LFSTRNALTTEGGSGFIKGKPVTLSKKMVVYVERTHFDEDVDLNALKFPQKGKRNYNWGGKMIRKVEKKVRREKKIEGGT